MNLDDFYKYFLTIIIFIISLIILSSILSIMGLSIDEAFKLSILTLMNTVNSSIYGLGEFDFNNLHFITKYILILFIFIAQILRRFIFDK